MASFVLAPVFPFNSNFSSRPPHRTDGTREAFDDDLSCHSTMICLAIAPFSVVCFAIGPFSFPPPPPYRRYAAGV